MIQPNRWISNGSYNISNIIRNTTYGGHTNLPHPKKTKVVAYYRYADDILIIYDQNKTNIEDTVQEFNNLQPTMNFTIEKEQHETTNFLDLTIHRESKNPHTLTL
jgi:hypothetical protein